MFWKLDMFLSSSEGRGKHLLCWVPEKELATGKYAVKNRCETCAEWNYDTNGGHNFCTKKVPNTHV
jgi:hypothetical protein